MKIALFSTLLVSAFAVTAFAAEEGVTAIHTGQTEFSGGIVATYLRGINMTKIGVNSEAGVSLHSHFTVIGEYNLTPLGSESVRYESITSKASARYHAFQAGG